MIVAALDLRSQRRLPAHDDLLAVAIGEGADLGGDLMLVVVVVEQVGEGDRARARPSRDDDEQHRRLDEHVGEREPQAVPGQDLEEAESGAAKRERVARAGRLLADREEGDERIQLVRQADRDRDRGGRHLVALPRRLVMVADRVGDRVGWPWARAR